MRPCKASISLALACFLASVFTSKMTAQESKPDTTESAQQRDQRMQWWREARFGLFVHWGPVSLKGTEIGWSRDPGPNSAKGGGIPAAEYDQLFKKFNPVKFNAKEWVAVAKAAGMKYLVFTTKHHDGFCEFDSKLTDYKITSPESPFGRDVVKELADACHEAGLKLGFYYSQPDSHHPDYRTANHARYLEYMHGQVRELLSNYGRVDIIWFDGLGGTAADWNAEKLFPMMKQLQPQIIINNRCGLPADYDTPEQTIGAFQINWPWESCITICNQWAWKPDDRMKTLEECLRTLITCAGGDGNLLFNVGPMPSGEIEPRQVARLKEMGAWLAKNGESIYGTRGGPFKPSKSVVSTRKGNSVYVHVLRWDGDSIALPELPAKIVSSALIGGGAVRLAKTETGMTLSVDKKDRHEIDTIIKLELDGDAEKLPVISLKGPGLIKPGMKASASNVYQKNAAYSAEKAFDCDSDTRWATDAGTKTAWLELDLGEPKTFCRAAIEEACGSRVQAFELQFRDSGEWRTFHKGTTIGDTFETPKFGPVTARYVRLNILSATEGPTITEFELLAK